MTSTDRKARLLVAASGTGGHLFPAIAVAQKLTDYSIEWLGVPDRLERQLVPSEYPLHTIPVTGFQQRLGLASIKIFGRLLGAIQTCRQLLKTRQIQAVFTTGGYIAAPAILAAKSLGIPVVLHESNAIPGKVTRLLAPFCDRVAVGFAAAGEYLPKAKTLVVGTPVREQFFQPQPLDLPIPEGMPLIVVVGGSQGALAVNQLVRQVAPAWLEAGAAIVHLTGESDPDAQSFSHPYYWSLPFYQNMAGLLQRANLAVSRAGAGTLTELALTGTPAILIPYPFAAEDHQAFNATVFAEAEAAQVYRQAELTADVLQTQGLKLLQDCDRLIFMAQQAKSLAVPDSANQLVSVIEQLLKSR